MAVEYVYPNTSEISLRGSLEERLELARGAGCSLVEVPADLIKNPTEVEVTGQGLCTFPDKRSIELLYKKSGTVPKSSRYILHTEPSIPRRDEYGLCIQAPIRWYDQEWVASFTRMILEISDTLTIPPEKIEIHPGDRRNSFADIVGAMQEIQDAYDRTFGSVPDILLENRTGQIISTGTEIAKFWDYFNSHNPGLLGSCGIVLDIQQLKTVTKKKFSTSFSQIPDNCLKGFHIHTLHHRPHDSDAIPWNLVFERISGLTQDLIINPEVHHNNQVPDVIGFCKERINQK